MPRSLARARPSARENAKAMRLDLNSVFEEIDALMPLGPSFA